MKTFCKTMSTAEAVATGREAHRVHGVAFVRNHGGRRWLGMDGLV